MLNFLNKKTAGPSSDQVEACGRFVKLIVSQAVAQHATKIVLGVPCEANCRRIPWEPRLVQDCPWDWEDEARLTGRNEADVVEERKARVESSRKEYAERRCLPLWFKIGDTYEELSPAPMHLFFELLRVMKSWDHCRIPWGEEKPDWDKVADLPSQLPDKGALSSLLLSLPLPPSGNRALSSFLLRLEDGRIIEAALGFEPSFCLSISLHDTGRRI